MKGRAEGKSLFESCRVSNVECIAVKEATVEQYKTPLWQQFRIGRITASKSHEVI